MASELGDELFRVVTYLGPGRLPELAAHARAGDGPGGSAA